MGVFLFELTNLNKDRHKLKMINQIEEVKKKFLEEIETVKDEKQLEEFRVKYLGRRGIIQTLFDKLK